MNLTQMVYIIGEVSGSNVKMLGTGFLFSPAGFVATAYHVIGPKARDLVVLLPNLSDINSYQDLDEKSCQCAPAILKETDPFRDLAILELKHDFFLNRGIPGIGGLDDRNVGDEMLIFGFPHCVEGRRVLTFQRGDLGAKVRVEADGIISKHGVINFQTRPGQSGSPVLSPKDGSISGILIGAWVPGPAEISLGGINPRELHQTTHCVSAEYLRDML